MLFHREKIIETSEHRLVEISKYLDDVNEEKTITNPKDGSSLTFSFGWDCIYVEKDGLLIFYGKNKKDYMFYNRRRIPVCSYRIKDKSYQYISYSNNDEKLVPELITGIYEIIESNLYL